MISNQMNGEFHNPHCNTVQSSSIQFNPGPSSSIQFQSNAIQFNPVQSNSIQVHPVQSSFNPMQYTSIQVHTIQSSFNPVQSTTIQVHKNSIQFQSNSKNTIQLNPAQVNPALLQSSYTQIQSNLTPALLQSSYVSIHLTSSTTPGNIQYNSRKHPVQPQEYPVQLQETSCRNLQLDKSTYTKHFIST
jgi:hypothetical protein